MVLGLLMLTMNAFGEQVPDYMAQRGLHLGAAWIITDLAYEFSIAEDEISKLGGALFVGFGFLCATQGYETATSPGKPMDLTNGGWTAAGVVGALLCNYKWGQDVKVSSAPGGAVVSMTGRW